VITTNGIQYGTIAVNGGPDTEVTSSPRDAA
jgi:hypothetical protein